MADQPQTTTTTQSNRIINQSANVSDLDISLHPLPILNISDHFTRTRLQAERQDIDIFGALIGTQIGKKIEIVNCFELLTDSDGKVNDGFLKTRREQFQQVFPTLDLLGWYTNGPEPREKDLAILNQVSECVDLSSPILLLYDLLPTPSSSSGSTTAAKELPVQIYEFTQATTGADGEGFVKCTFDVQTSEAERIAVDCVAKPDVGSNESGLVSNLITQRNAIQMLHNKLGSIVDYLAQLMADLEPENPTATATKIDHGLLREISSLVASLPKPDENASFKKEYMTEFNDALLTSYLSSQSKVLTETNQLIDRYLYLNARDNNLKFGSSSASHSVGKSLKMPK
ncbi:hypothetical protein PGT21_035254 [Puccinia graminis f. sp. tritici]|uniref:COP9 signalosome complex subunit 6 n=2 Tax=Puccinia graminis f. sp. tritici TaxID=56615 RepID=E3JQY2_PUCGT|nr:uncharacterized protein PGTG_00195 [Puccinia graminis f. sp. tritici CRL 75-36-700-3]EFP74239.2 hypothetical protein PGTG_00195 [Puccinia graminis f. sp. tritici CRL 75-36-700-3]KAA1115326.1 hypothetical protein PGT21_035254 [Puccinia graminis f. sp. tritici]